MGAMGASHLSEVLTSVQGQIRFYCMNSVRHNS
jgi:hypothetical protein